MAVALTFPDGAALVAGGTGTVGGGIVRRLCDAGTKVVFTYHSQMEKADALARSVEGRGPGVLALRMDMSDDSSVAAGLDAAVAFAGRVHSVIYAGGRGAGTPFAKLADFDAETVEEYLLNDAMSCFRLFRAAVAHLRRNGGGALLACTTVATRRVLDYDGISPFAKGSVEALVRQIAAEEGSAGIRCNAVGIGLVTEHVELETILGNLEKARGTLRADLINQIAGAMRLKRTGTPEDAGNLFAFLASEQSSYVTGQIIELDGGVSL